MKTPYDDRIKELEGPKDYPDTPHSLYVLSKAEVDELEILYCKVEEYKKEKLT